MTSPAPLGPGDTVGGDYKLLRQIDSGAMSTVWSVEQVSTGRECALKLLNTTMLRNARIRARFAQEARVSARIESDHVVKVLAAGVDEARDLPWIAMELLKGENLDGRIRRAGPLAAGEAREVFRQLRDALAAAHRQAIVHRDVKAENVFIAVPRRPALPFMVKVLDFGIAKVLEDPDARMTAGVGSPKTMAPEQTKRGVVSPATDVWSLGLLAFRALTGRHYWQAAQGKGTNVPALVSEVQTGRLDPATVRAQALGAEAPLPAGFDAWFARCVVRAPEARYQDADEALGALLALFDAPAVPAAPARADAALAPAPAPARRAPLPLVAAAVAALATALALAAWLLAR